MGIIILVVALIALAVAMLFVFKPFGLFEDPLDIDSPTMEQVSDVFMESDAEQSALSRFQYVNTENMDDPIISNVSIGELAQNDSGNKDVYCDATANATYQNDAIVAKTTLTTRLTYNKTNGEWVSNGVRTGDVEAEPIAGPDMEEIKDNIVSMVRSYDSNVGTDFNNSEVSTDANLGKNGGAASFVLTKKDSAEGDESSTCTVNTNIEWSDSRGWLVEIISIDGLPEPEPEPEAPAEETPATETPAEEPPAASSSSAASTATNPPASSSNSGSGSSGSSGSSGNSGSSSSSGQPTMLLRCWTGDLVQVPGVIQFEGSHILLRTDHVIRVEFDNRVYITTYFELTGNANLVNGQHVTVIGEILATGTLDKAPLVINLNYD